ncbi:hypothetical protein HNQ60_000640 [Povalibacter uvarum]|uniref:Toxin CptA n=1 Tax=Povalibacter uvarum TaxID=732238 RepID=A0A841HGV3_9GAMM|nr:protein YgfX [Povalibacter uvarum]MBB6091794.1 hypothetical protein [Povalibacter uvarum]
MSSHGSPTLASDLRTRRAESACAALLIALGSSAPALIGPLATTGLKITCAVALAAVLAVAFRRAGWLGGGGALTRMVWRGDGGWTLTFRSGRQVEAALDGSTRMSPAAIWLHWALDGAGPRTRSLLLIPGDLPETDFRRLLVRLRLDQSECAPTAQQTDPTLT